MFEYVFTREFVDGAYSINNSNRLDGESNQIYLAKEIETALPNKFFTLHCNGTEAKFKFKEELTVEEQNTLTSIMNAHKNNT